MVNIGSRIFQLLFYAYTHKVGARNGIWEKENRLFFHCWSDNDIYLHTSFSPVLFFLRTILPPRNIAILQGAKNKR